VHNLFEPQATRHNLEVSADQTKVKLHDHTLMTNNSR